ncbi:DUF6624 domain-containing protein [Micromonospora zamorensis]|uniref:DUF6624 domain-containing protein n=1 Tax=Micromonospora zamorensis TaxID=709883 RepID=UPI00341106F5
MPPSHRTTLRPGSRLPAGGAGPATRGRRRRQVSPGNLAYLQDRVATGKDEPQEYGTQIRWGPGGPVPATPIRDEADVERRRAEAGLPTLASYLAELTTVCPQDTN